MSQLVFVVSVPIIAVAMSGCGSSDILSSDVRLFPSKIQFFPASDSTAAKAASIDPVGNGPVSPDDYIDAAGHCGVVAGQSDVAVGTVAGDLGTTSTATPQATVPSVPGGVALGMTECQVAARAGQPGQVNIAGGENNERKVVLTYSSGPWPGIYTFSDGRLKDIQGVAHPEQPKAAKKKGRNSRPATASAPTSQRAR